MGDTGPGATAPDTNAAHSPEATSSVAAQTPRLRQHPTGTVTFLFTDIEGSTAKWEKAPEAMRQALAEHDTFLRECIEAHNGWVFAHSGDGVRAVFSNPRKAIDAAIAAQRGLELPVRMGIVTGEAQTRDENYFGPTPNRAARVMTAGYAGQVVVGASTAAVVSGVELRDLGKHRLRDVADVVRLFQVEAEGLKREFPPLKTDTSMVNNLPVATTDLIGRDTEIIALMQLLQTQRLVTLTGMGGVGKTSLAQHVASQLTHEFPDGIGWVELAAVRDSSGVPDAIAGALGITPNADSTVTESIANALSGRRMLVVLDNCEHVIDAAATVAAALLGGSERLAIIATSREHLRVAGERVWAVPSLDYAGADSPAVELFLQRARSLTNVTSGPEDVDAIIDICEHLDGLAFAIELAAARVVSMTPGQIRDRLNDRFRLLSGPRRGLAHQQTLRQTVQWSYDLLEPTERLLLNRLAVFVDGFDLQAATEVAGLGESDEYVVLDGIESLVRKSLVTTERVGAHVRYRMLETIREFAIGELAATTEVEALQRRHASYYADLSADYWRRWNGPEQREALEWVEMEFPNLRAAFRSSADQDDLTTAAAIAAHSALLAQVLQQYEAVSWAEEIIDKATASQIPNLSRLYTAVVLAAMTGRPAAAMRYGKVAASLECDDPIDEAWGRFFTALAHRYNGQVDQWFEMCSELAEGEGLARALGLLGMLTVPSALQGPSEIRTLGDDAVALARSLENGFLIAYSLSAYGRALAGEASAEALGMLHEAHSYAQAQRLSYWKATIAREIAALEAAHGHPEEALRYFEDSLDSFQRMGNRSGAAMALASLSAAFNRVNKPSVAATLYGWYTRFGTTLPAYLPEGLDLPGSGPGYEDLDAAKERGAEMDFSEAMHYARRQIQIARDDVPAG